MRREGLGPLMAAGPRVVCRPPREAREVVSLGERGKEE